MRDQFSEALVNEAIDIIAYHEFKEAEKVLDDELYAYDPDEPWWNR